MPTLLATSIDKLLDDVRDAYIKDQESKGIRSSGASAKSIRKEVKEASGILYGAGYFYQQRHGRKPGRFPPIDSIIDWIRAKGITPTDISERSLAFIIARKIAKQGTDIFTGKRQGLDPDEKIRSLMSQFTKSAAKEIQEQISKSLQ